MWACSPCILIYELTIAFMALNLISILIHISYFVFLQHTSCFNNQTDFLSLLAIKSAVNDDPFGALDSWNKTTHFCSWNGIRCGSRHRDRVVGIQLLSQGLVGTLSPFVGNLSFLRSINLQNNTFHGPIPPQIGLLRRLESLVLQNNSFVGAIPTNLSQCPNLRRLFLCCNELSGGIPTELGSLSQLQVLVLSRNSLSGTIPPSIGNLTSLIQLSLLTCSLNGEIPTSFAQLRRLTFLQISDNYLTGSIPSALFNISTIKFFYAAGNYLSGVLPSSLGVTLSNLGGLYLWGNNFSGPIPLSISNASMLGQLDLSENSLTGPLPRVGGLTRLRSYIFESNLLVDDMSFMSSLINSTELEMVGVGGNLLSGSLPNSVANLSTRLSSLSMYGNMISGSIPSGIGNLIGLTSIDLHDNDLEGSIPTSIGKLSVMNGIDAHANRLTNALPSSFGNLTSLYIMDLSENRLSGNLPSNLGNCTSMNYLDLSRNEFSGLIPPQLVSLSSLSRMFNLSFNNFYGLIPYEVGLLKVLGTLDLSNNRLSGLIPDSLGQCTSLEILYLEGNLLQGEIPAGMSGLKALKYLDFSRNNLSGRIPDFLGQLKLERLNLSFNSLQGEVPMMGVFMNETSIYLDGNELCGGIPELKLPRCSVVESQKRDLSFLIPTLVVGSIGLMLLAIFITYKRRKSRENVTPANHFSGIEIMRLSYADLVRATGGFCEANLLGSGRFGSVYRGILEDGEARVAVKVLNLSVRGASKSFLAECNALRSVRHRNIVKILSVCESIDFQGDDFNALVYELKENGSLEKWLHHRREEEEGEENVEINSLSLIQMVNIAIDIAQAIEYLHIGTDSCIVHGDLKPSNILLDHDMTACVGDFGLARIISNVAQSLESNSIGIAGTLGYVAPEYATNNLVSMQGDVYSYGILVLEMLTSKRPTDEEFYDHVNLHNFVSDALSNHHAAEIVEKSIVIGLSMNPKLKDCVEGTLRIGIACSRTAPTDRMSITDVVKDLCKIRDSYLS